MQIIITKWISKWLERCLSALDYVHPSIICLIYISILYLKVYFKDEYVISYDHNITFYFVAIGVAIIPSFIMQRTFVKPSDITVLLLYTIVYIPLQTFSLFTGDVIKSVVLFFNISVCISFCGLILTLDHDPIKRLTLPSISQVSISNSVIRIVFMSMLALAVYTFGMPSFEHDIFDTRVLSREVIAQSPIPYFKQLLGVFQNLLNMIGLMIAIKRRDYILIGIIAVLQIYISVATYQYGTILMPVAFLFVYFVAVKFHKHLFAILLSSQVFFIVTFTLLWMVDRTQRDLVMRAYKYHITLTPKYISYFSDYGYTYLSESKVVSAILGVPQSKDPAQIIGQHYYFMETWANENFWAGAFANFGFVGVFAYTIVLYFLLAIYNNLSKKKDFIMSSMVLLPPTMIMCNGSLPSTLISGGMILIYALLFMLPNKSSAKVIKQ